MSTRTNFLLSEVQFAKEATFKTKVAATNKIEFLDASIKGTLKEGRRDDVVNNRLQGNDPLVMYEDLTLHIKKRINLEGDGLLIESVMGTTVGPTQQATSGIYDVSFTKLQAKDMPSLCFEVKDQDDNIYFLVGAHCSSAKFTKFQKGDYSEVEFDFIVPQILTGIAYLQQAFTTAASALTIYFSDRDIESEFAVSDTVTITDGVNTLSSETLTAVSGNSVSFITTDTGHTFDPKITTMTKTIAMTAALVVSSAPLSNPVDLLMKIKEPGAAAYSEDDTFYDGDLTITNKYGVKHTSNRSKYVTIKPVLVSSEAKGNLKVLYNSKTDTWLDKTKQVDQNGAPYTWDIIFLFDTLLPAGDATDTYSFSIAMPKTKLNPERPSIAPDEMTEMSVPFEVLDPKSATPLTIAYVNEESAI